MAVFALHQQVRVCSIATHIICIIEHIELLGKDLLWALKYP